MKTRITILTAMYNRPRVSELFCMSITRLKNYHEKNFELTVHAAVTGADSVAVCQKYGVSYVETPNQPLGDKWNLGMMDALKRYQQDYFLIMGDDDISANELLTEYTPFIEKHTPYFGVNSLYFYDSKLKKAAQFRYKQSTSKLVGCGRMISRLAAESTGWKTKVKAKKDMHHHGVMMYKNQFYSVPKYQADYLAAMRYAEIQDEEEFLLWDASLQRSLDNSSELNLLFNNYLSQTVHLKRPMITDVKTRQNLWAYQQMAAQCVRVNPEDALWFFSDEEKKMVQKLI